jgi:2-polyprenyl-6-methoxyphenol hydroxylase-like FAD-dependent oxidoreductase
LTRSGRLRDPAGLSIYFASRPLLEHLVFKRVQKARNIFVMDGHDVAEVTFDTNRISGARVVNIGTGDTTAVTVDLVVDAAGRGSRTPAPLEALGHGRPQQDEIVVRLTYTSQFLSIPVSMRPDVHIGRFQSRDDQKVMPCGRMRIIHGYSAWLHWERHPSPSQRGDMISHVERIAPPDFVDTVRVAEPLGEPVRYTFPSSRWRRYDKMRNAPDGLLAVGDAICSLDPVYGQGMPVAAIEALRDGQRKLPQRFFRSTAKTIGVAWRMAVGSDLALPEVTGRPTVSMRFTGAYLDRVLTAAESDPIVAEQLLRVTGMIDSSSPVLHPAILARVATARRRPSERNGAASGYIFSDG